MKITKNIITVLLLLMTMFVLTACEGKENKKQTEEEVIQEFIEEKNELRQEKNPELYEALQNKIEEVKDRYEEALEIEDEKMYKNSRTNLGQATFVLDSAIKYLPRETWKQINNLILEIDSLMENKENPELVAGFCDEIFDILEDYK